MKIPDGALFQLRVPDSTVLRFALLHAPQHLVNIICYLHPDDAIRLYNNLQYFLMVMAKWLAAGLVEAQMMGNHSVINYGA